MVKKSNWLVELQSKSKKERQVTHFYRLCRNYGIKSSKTYLKNYHDTDPNISSKRFTDDVIDVVLLFSQLK